MLYYTQLIFIKKDQEATFHSFEDKVLPLLARYNGKLLYRIRPDKHSVIACHGELPYEIHIVTFDTRADFENYGSDPDRLQAMDLKNGSVARVMLIEGRML